MKQYCDTLGRSLHVVNLGKHACIAYIYAEQRTIWTLCVCVCSDPAAENFNYPVSIDVRELISLQDVMEELDLGPNGCVKYKSSCFPHS